MQTCYLIWNKWAIWEKWLFKSNKLALLDELTDPVNLSVNFWLLTLVSWRCTHLWVVRMDCTRINRNSRFFISLQDVKNAVELTSIGIALKFFYGTYSAFTLLSMVFLALFSIPLFLRFIVQLPSWFISYFSGFSFKMEWMSILQLFCWTIFWEWFLRSSPNCSAYRDKIEKLFCFFSAEYTSFSANLLHSLLIFRLFAFCHHLTGYLPSWNC